MAGRRDVERQVCILQNPVGILHVDGSVCSIEGYLLVQFHSGHIEKGGIIAGAFSRKKTMPKVEAEA